MAKKNKRNKRRENKKIIIGGALVALLLVGLFYYSSRGGEVMAAGSANWTKISQNDAVKGNLSSPIVIIEYADLQCPACAGFNLVIKEVWHLLKEEVQYVFRNFPLVQVHPQAMEAAHFLEAVRKAAPEKFWEYHDVLLARQAEWAGKRDASVYFMRYLTELQVDAERIQQMVKQDGTIEDKIDADFRTARAAGVNSTPSLYIVYEDKIQALRPVRDPNAFYRQVQAFRAAVGK